MTTHSTEIARARNLVEMSDGAIAKVPLAIVAAALRFALAIPFFLSGLTKWDGLALSDNARFLFREEFRLHVLGAVYPYPAPDLMAWAAAIGEILLPALLIVGLFTRHAALGLLVMTGVIQLTIPDGWANFHLPWAAMALAIMHMGPGAASVDRLMASRSA